MLTAERADCIIWRKSHTSAIAYLDSTWARICDAAFDDVLEGCCDYAEHVHVPERNTPTIGDTPAVEREAIVLR